MNSTLQNYFCTCNYCISYDNLVHIVLSLLKFSPKKKQKYTGWLDDPTIPREATQIVQALIKLMFVFSKSMWGNSFCILNYEFLLCEGKRNDRQLRKMCLKRNLKAPNCNNKAKIFQISQSSSNPGSWHRWAALFNQKKLLKFEQKNLNRLHVGGKKKKKKRKERKEISNRSHNNTPTQQPDAAEPRESSTEVVYSHSYLLSVPNSVELCS